MYPTRALVCKMSNSLHAYPSDWFDPTMRIDEWNPIGTEQCTSLPCDPSKYNNQTDTTGWRRFVNRHRSQVLEVLTKYGEILELSFDM